MSKPQASSCSTRLLHALLCSQDSNSVDAFGAWPVSPPTMPVAPLQRGGNRASSNSTFGNNQPSSSINSNYTHHHQHSHSTNIKDDNRSAPHLGPMLHHGRGSAPPPAFKGGCNSGTNSPPRGKGTETIKKCNIFHTSSVQLIRACCVTRRALR